ncbi:snRNA-activating protein complex subunit 2 [Amia ocellicauda]|uniref:snRNA-activating protein complex subunit 2 n=1 Tax=Amia ocellicauda TaxID=2972642 RepID=UPI003463E8CC
MKPPSRKRVAPVRYGASGESLEPVRPGWTAWTRAEKRRLLAALRQQRFFPQVDLQGLQEKVRGHSQSEISEYLEFLKGRVGYRVAQHLSRQRLEEKRRRVPVQRWAELAQDMAGTVEVPIAAAFSQMLVIAATEPCSLMHSLPPQPLKLEDKTFPPLGRPHLSAPMRVSQQVPTLLSRTTSTNHSPAAHGNPVMPSTVPQSSSQNSARPAHLLTSSNPVSPPVSSSNPSPQLPLASNPTPAPPTSHPAGHSTHSDLNQAQSPGPSNRSQPHTDAQPASSSQVSGSARPTSQHAAGSGALRVDFEKLYRYLNAMAKQTSEPPLTALESAVLLDLLMSLPEELHLLEGRELQHHLRQVHSRLSAPAEPRTPGRRHSSPAKPETTAQTAADQEAGSLPPPPADSGVENGGRGQTVPANHEQESSSHEMGDGDRPASWSAAGIEPTNESGAAAVSTNETKSAMTPANPETEPSSAISEQGGVEQPAAMPLATETASPTPGHSHPSETPTPQQDAGKDKSDWPKAGLCPLNPFMIPLKLLAQKGSGETAG